MTKRPLESDAYTTQGELSTSTFWRSFRTLLPFILGIALLGAGLMYIWQRAKPPVYESFASVVATSGISDYDKTSNRVPALPEAAVREALRGPDVITEIIGTLDQNKTLPSKIRAEMTSRLQNEFRARQLSSLQISADLDFTGTSGLYVITSTAPTAQGAAILADTAVNALISWDARRGQGNLDQVKRGLLAQIAALEGQVRTTTDATERTTISANLRTARTELSQVEVAAAGIRGAFSRVAGAVAPVLPASPKPLRSAIVVFTVVVLLGTLLSLFSALNDRTLHVEEDLLGFEVPTLGVLPRLSRREILLKGFVRTARQAGLYEAIGFLRINLEGRLQGARGRCILISSTIPGEGKSSVTAALADGLASDGQKVLIIDSDLRRGTQGAIWSKYDPAATWKTLKGEGSARNFQQVVADPSNVAVLTARENVDVLPAGPGLHDTISLLNTPGVGDLIEELKGHYDFVIIDSPPLLVLADGLVVGKYTDGVVVVTEASKTSLQNVKRVLRRADSANIEILGFVINKVRKDSSNAYYYNYQSRTSNELS
jgi:capsular exopolysaccharide synthesis family protein